MLEALVAGGGIGGLAAALALAQGGCRVRLFEQSAGWTEAGAGIQLGSNATRVLRGWGLERELLRVAAAQERLIVRSVAGGAALATLRLGASFADRYGAPYLCVHRADLHRVLREGAHAAGADLQLGRRIAHIDSQKSAVRLRFEDGDDIEGDLLVGADGVWSALRLQLLADGVARPTGHVAYRALLAQSELPARLRSGDINVWLGPRSHVVAYPVRQGECLNVVVIVEGQWQVADTEWDREASAASLQAALGPLHADLDSLLQAPRAWRQWSLHERSPLQSAGQMASSRIALLGDAAHPMRPYLAQGAAMALEDAAELARVLAGAAGPRFDVSAALQRYASVRWRRCARVQRRAQRNGHVFHFTGPLRWGRDAALRLLGERLLDLPWLYGY